jgi:hypothetical protein
MAVKYLCDLAHNPIKATLTTAQGRDRGGNFGGRGRDRGGGVIIDEGWLLRAHGAVLGQHYNKTTTSVHCECLS